MCGIVGYVGHRPCLSILVEGLKRLEYRGYDSAGIAIQENGTIDVIKRAGKIRNLGAPFQMPACPGGPQSPAPLLGRIHINSDQPISSG